LKVQVVLLDRLLDDRVHPLHPKDLETQAEEEGDILRFSAEGEEELQLFVGVPWILFRLLGELAKIFEEVGVDFVDVPLEATGFIPGLPVLQVFLYLDLRNV